MHYVKCFLFVTKSLFARSATSIALIVILTLAVSFIEVLGLSLLIPILEVITKQAQDSLITDYIHSFFNRLSLESTIENILTLGFIVFFIRLLAHLLSGICLKYAQLQLVLNVNKDVVDSYTHYQTSVYDDLQKSGLVNNILNQEIGRYDGLIKNYGALITNITHFIAYNSFILISNWALFIIFFISILVFIGGFAPLFKRDFSRSKSLISVNENIISGTTQFIQTLHYTRATSLEKKLSFHIKSLMDQRFKNIFLSKINASVMKSIGESLPPLLVITFIYIYLIMYQKIEAESLVLILAAFRVIQSSLNIQQGLHSVAVGTVALNNIESTISKLKHNQEPQAELIFPPTQAIFTLDSIKFSYQDQVILHNASLTLQPRDYIGIVGSSGAGKTTLLLILLGMLKPTEGAISYAGIPYDQLDLSVLRRRVGYVPQDLVTFSGSLFNNITLWDDRTCYEESRLRAIEALKIAQGPELIDSLDRDLGERGMHLSGGQRQRIALARELYRKPEILILDEATNALDSLTESSVLKELDHLRRHMTIVAITHRLTSVCHCDRIYVLQSGQFVESGSFKDLIANPTGVFRKMWDEQQREAV